MQPVKNFLILCFALMLLSFTACKSHVDCPAYGKNVSHHKEVRS